MSVHLAEARAKWELRGSDRSQLDPAVAGGRRVRRMTAWFQSLVGSAGLVPRDPDPDPADRAAADAGGGDDHLCRPQDLGGDGAAARAQRGRAVRPAAELRRRAQGLPQGDDHPVLGQSRPVPDRADHHLHRGAGRLGGDPVRPTAWVLADINVGLLYLLAVSSLGVYGIIIAGWASNSKYPFYSALRAAAQMVSYEVSIGFVLIPVVLWAGTFNLSGDRRGAAGPYLRLRQRLRLQSSAVPAGGDLPDLGAWPRPRARRSTSPRRRASSSPATRPNIAR